MLEPVYRCLFGIGPALVCCVSPDHYIELSLASHHGFGRYLCLYVDVQSTETTYLPVEQLHSRTESLIDQEALGLHPQGHPYHSISLNNPAMCLSTWNNQLGAMEDLNEAIVLN